MVITNKNCSKCGLELQLTSEYFRKSKNTKDGFQSECKSCKKIRDQVYRQKHKIQINEYYKSNKFKFIAREMNQRANNIITEYELQIIVENFKDKNGIVYCAYCNREILNDGMLHMEHITPISKGGNNTITNIIPVCKYCNRSKAHDNFIEWYRNQFFYNEKRERLILKYTDQTSVKGIQFIQNATIKGATMQ